MPAFIDLTGRQFGRVMNRANILNGFVNAYVEILNLLDHVIL